VLASSSFAQKRGITRSSNHNAYILVHFEYSEKDQSRSSWYTPQVDHLKKDFEQRRKKESPSKQNPLNQAQPSPRDLYTN
jgi:hypothetical protein